jgi:hypothetical protein
MTPIKAIETQYKGYRFRSRLEARWAVFFDTLGLEWEYEKEGYETILGRYLPDFYFPKLDCFAEVKPGFFTDEQYRKCKVLPKPCILLDQPHPTAQPYFMLGATEGIYSRNRGDGWGWVILSHSQYKGHLWFCFGEDYHMNYYAEEIKAEDAAKSARFEFGDRE